MNWNTKFVSTVCHRQSPDHVMAENGSWKNFHVFNFLGKFALVTWKTTPTIKQNKTHIKYIAQITVIWRFTHIPRPWELLRTPQIWTLVALKASMEWTQNLVTLPTTYLGAFWCDMTGQGTWCTCTCGHRILTFPIYKEKIIQQ